MEKNFRPKLSLRSTVIKNALRSYFVPAFARKYQVAAVRTLWNVELDIPGKTIWGKRRELEEFLYNNENIVAYVSCVTAHSQVSHKRKRESSDEESDSKDTDVANIPGIAFWIVFDWPEFANDTFEERLSKLFMEAGLNLMSCKSIRGRGKYIRIVLSC